MVMVRVVIGVSSGEVIVILVKVVPEIFLKETGTCSTSFGIVIVHQKNTKPKGNN